MVRPRTLLVVGVHREELAFGEAVAADLDQGLVDVLVIPDGLSGQRPGPHGQFHYEMLHRALYLQLLPYLIDRYTLLIDLHTGRDPFGPGADLICADDALRVELSAMIDSECGAASHEVRIVALGRGAALHARTFLPTQIWRHPAFRYLCIEVYLPDEFEGRAAALRLAQRLVSAAARCAEIAAAGVHP